MKKIHKTIIYLIIIFTTIVLHDFSNEAGQNMISIGVMACCPLVLMNNLKHVEKNDIYILGVLLLIYLSKLISPNTFRTSSAIYSTMFIIQFITYKTLLKKELISIYDFKRLLTYILYGFFFCLIIQQTMELFGIDGFNRFGYFSDRFKMNSLAQEPSYLPPTIILLMYAIIRIDEKIKGKINSLKSYINTNKKLWFIFIFMMLTCGSTTAIFITPILFIYFIKNNIFKYFPPAIIICIIILKTFQFINPNLTTRATTIANALLSFDPFAIYDADPSASARIAPYLLYIQDFSINDLKSWFGQGMDYATYHLSYTLLGEEYGSEIGIGGFINFMYDYGLIACLLFILYMRINVFKKIVSFDFFMWITIFSVQDFRVNLFWFYFIILRAITHFENKKLILNNYGNINSNSNIQCR